MDSSENSTSDSKGTSLGYKVGVFGVVLILLWIGIFKFTPTEAKIIEGLVLNHPLMGWLYSFLSLQTVSNLIGATEIIVAAGLIYGFRDARVGFISGIAATVIFVSTLSFLLTTPGIWKVADSILITEFFLVKDFVFLGIALMVVEHNRSLLKPQIVT